MSSSSSFTGTVGGSGSAVLAGFSQCEDFIQFENALRQSRAVDDKIIQALNNIIPNASLRKREQVDVSSQCKQLWGSIDETYSTREKALNKCILFTQDRVRSLRESGDRAGARQSQVTLRMLESERGVEDVVRKRTQTAFHEKCRDYYSPTSS